jgi:mannan endo-1,4-beta-mannosidase
MKQCPLLFILLLSSISAFAVQYSATTATLSGDAVVSGNYVKMQEGAISFNSVSVSSAGMYDIKIRYMQDYDDTKKQNLVINGDNVGEIDFPRTTVWKDIVAVARMKSGNNTVAITKNWGWVDIQYIDVVPHENTPFNLSKNLVNSNANAAAKKMFAFMQEKFQKKIISGVMTGDVLNNNNAVSLNNQKEVSFIRQSSNNKTPALVGFDFMHGTGKNSEQAWFKSYNSATISLAKELYQRGGIPAFCWHWKDPLKNDEAFYKPGSGTPSTTFDLTKACTNANCTAWNANSNEYKAILADIDIVAGYLKELQTAGVAVLWRPVHEPSGGWFWWGANGAAPFKLLYKLIFDRLTDTHGLNNLIWVWNSEGSDFDWYPGTNSVDIIGRDFYYYPAQKNHASLIGEFEKLKNLFGTTKMLALAENGSIPYPENLETDGAGWSYFMPWYGEHTNSSSHNVANDWNKIMNHNYVITLEDMPGWANYNPSSSSSSLVVSSSSRASSSSSRAVSSSSRANSSSSSSRATSSSSRANGSSSSAGTTAILPQGNFYDIESVKYYSLQGQALGDIKPQKAGVYIVKKGYSVKKIIVR